MNTDQPARGNTRSTVPKPRPIRRASARHVQIPWGPIFVVLLVGGAIAAFFGARPGWRYIKAMRAERFVAESDAYFNEEKWTQGFEKIRAALQLSPINPKVLRAAGYAYGRFGNELGFMYLDALLATPGATVKDREEYAALALRVGNLELARAHIDELLESPTPSPRALILGAQFHTIRREPLQALKLAREAVRIAPENPTNQFSVASILISSKYEKDINEARAILWPHARARGPLQIRALGAILNAQETPRPERQEVEKILAALPNRTLDEELLLADTRISLDPSIRGRTADEYAEKYGRGDAQQVAQIARWLNRQGLFSRTRDLLLPDVAKKDAALFRLRYEALAGMNDLRGAYEFIMEDKPPGNPLEVEFARCAMAMRLKDQVAVDTHYKNLLAMSHQSVRALRAVAEFAFHNGNRKVANEVFQLLMKTPRDAVPALRGLIRNADAVGETWTARDYARKLSSILPKEDENLKLQLAYYDLLLKENIEEASASAHALQQGKPEDFNRRVVLALAHLRRNQPDKALTLVESQIVSWDRTIPGMRAVVAAVFGANGQAAAASNAISRTPLSRLKPEERELIKPYLRGTPNEGADETAGTAPDKR